MRALARLLLSFVVVAPLSACSDGQTFVVGSDQPVVVRDGVFHRGALPVDTTVTSPAIAGGVSTSNLVLALGTGGREFTGYATKDAYSVGVAFPGLGDGYWVVPVDAPDPTVDNQYGWSLVADFARDLPVGNTPLSFVAFDRQGHAGPRYDLTLCIVPDLSDNLNACDPTKAPPDATISLSWDTDVDLDLVVVTPAGKVVRTKRPTTAVVDGGTIPLSTVVDGTTGRLSRDSNAGCLLDSVRRESLTFVKPPPGPPGEYRIYASLFDACGKPSVHYRLTLYRSVDHGDGTYSVATTRLTEGDLTAVQADAGATLGTYVTSVTLP